MAIVGPTASGKSDLAMTIAEKVGASILSVDSMQVYRGMDIGTAKPAAAERARVRHHMIDIAEPEEVFSVAEFRAAARAAIADDPVPVMLVVGGSGLHFRSVVDPMTFRPTEAAVRAALEGEDPDRMREELLAADPGAAAEVDLANPRRVLRAVETLRITGLTPTQWAGSEERRRYRSYEAELEFVGIALDSPDLEGRVATRLDLMREAGLLAEVEQLAPRLGPTAAQAVGYAQLLAVVEGRQSPDEGFLAARRATMGLVKRQRTFFRRDPRLTWLDPTAPDLAEAAMTLLGL